MEHNKQNDWHSREFFIERNAFANSSYGGNGIPGGGGVEGGGIGGSNNVLYNGNYWNENRFISKKVQISMAIHNSYIYSDLQIANAI